MELANFSKNRLYRLLTEAYGEPDSSTPLVLRKCNDLKNFLEEKARQEAESLKKEMYFKQTPAYYTS